MMFGKIVSVFLTCFLLTLPLLHGQTAPVPAADHHIHVRGEAGSEAFVRILKKLEDRDIGTLPPVSPEQVIQALDAGDIDEGVILSSAYFFGIPDLSFDNEYEQVMAENDYTMDAARSYPERLTAFISVNPLKGYAGKEIERCASNQSGIGVKLHLANSGVDLRNPGHVDSLRTICNTASQLELPVIIHLFTRNPDYGRKDARIFIGQVLAEVPDLTIQVAHMGGAGLYTTNTDGVMMEFEQAVSEYPDVMDDDLVFDIAASARNPENALSRGDTARAEALRLSNTMLAEEIKQIGVQRVVFGTDWVGFSRAPADFTETVQSIPLSEQMIQKLFENRAPYLEE
ncbi:MAG: amidohydrolase family protein [Candidatus Marinimicrobia bacterium]|nr:amidohydrolase family protein [Candidatus Neomarinimicrobiota bacterium]